MASLTTGWRGSIATAQWNERYNPVFTSGPVLALAVQPMMTGCWSVFFTEINGTNRANLARLNTDGTLDTSFNPGTGANAAVRAIMVRTNGGIMIGGNFTSYNGTNRGCIAGLDADGNLDPAFNVGTGVFFENPTLVDTFALQPDGKVLVGGHFDTYNGTGAEGLARLNTDGKLSTPTLTPAPSTREAFTFMPWLSSQTAKCSDGGNFSDLSSWAAVLQIARINTNGTLDATFNSGTGALAPVYPLGLFRHPSA